MRTRRRVTVGRHPLIRRLRYRPVTRWFVTGMIVVVAAAFVQRTSADAADRRHRWGETRVVAVARQRIPIGAVIEAGAVTSQSWPVALVPEGALDSAPTGRTAIATIEAGEAVLAGRVAPDGLHGAAALVPAGWRALAIPVAPTVIALDVGDHVDLVAGFDVAEPTADRSPSLTVARDALVVAVDEQRVTVAVRDDDAERVAFAIVAGTVVPALRSS
ncbi:MAG TPA: SAF domain-containing protein [Mycobacteriales bacterium]|nr:SAF domain-containing protein [Mycobacteriales bacterium]